MFPSIYVLWVGVGAGFNKHCSLSFLCMVGLTDELLQLEQLGREWSVKVYNILSTLESLSLELLALGLDRKLWQSMEPADLPQMLKEENTRLKDLLKSACYG